MDPAAGRRSIIPADIVHRTSQHVLVDNAENVNCENDRTVSVVPLMSGNQVSGIEVRCSCGSIVVIECVYDAVEGTASPQPTEPTGTEAADQPRETADLLVEQSVAPEPQEEIT